VVEKQAPVPAKTPEPQDNPEQPDNPVPPGDKPPILLKLCDLSASILAPPTVYEHESYSFTVSFTNQSDLELANAILRGTSNDAVLTPIPETYNFKPRETKPFTITSTAGNAGEIYTIYGPILQRRTASEMKTRPTTPPFPKSQWAKSLPAIRRINLITRLTIHPTILIILTIHLMNLITRPLIPAIRRTTRTIPIAQPILRCLQKNSATYGLTYPARPRSTRRRNTALPCTLPIPATQPCPE